ncbi:hypothetical protein AB1L42_20155 [Thalassoglobus sp. JC818]|uniref:hypothetical protein n=1 Tax=Thalassoglobus sp. JC818 TaxID=3232136 RepID=UPI00345AA851
MTYKELREMNLSSTESNGVDSLMNETSMLTLLWWSLFLKLPKVGFTSNSRA